MFLIQLSLVRTRLAKQRIVYEQTECKLDELRISLSLSLPHEIRTTLSGIIGFAEVLRDDSTNLKPTEISEMASIILKSATRLGHLVENFLTYAQLELFSADPKKRELIQRETASMLNLHIEELAQKKAKEYERPNDVVLKLGGGGAAISNENLKRIAEELIDNAFKFSKAGAPVQVHTQQEGACHVLTVSDQGVGMEAKQTREIGAYRQFNRAKHEQQGSGLGLAIAKLLAELHGGALSLQSEVGKGTTVAVKLPTPEPN